ncbi:MAG: hypothetical protein IJZ64_06040 [Ruminococcus sp.]|nr:hypothetical protein [Ruminococcus sp.]
MKIKKAFIKTVAIFSVFSILMPKHLISVEVRAINIPSPIAWQQNRESGAEVQRELYLPYEENWCDIPWNRGTETGNTVGAAGCSLFSVINSVYYKTGKFISPAIPAQFALDYGYRIPGVDGVGLGFFDAFADSYGEEYGFSFAGDTTSAYTALEHVRNGGTACSNISWHWIAVVDYDPETDMYLVLDSAQSCQRANNVTWTDRENGVLWLDEETLCQPSKNGYYGFNNRYSELLSFSYVEPVISYEIEGDVNGNGEIDVDDASIILEYYAKHSAGFEDFTFQDDPELEDIVVRFADINGDGSITVDDATIILEIYARESAGLLTNE